MDAVNSSSLVSNGTDETLGDDTLTDISYSYPCEHGFHYLVAGETKRAGTEKFIHDGFPFFYFLYFPP